METTNREETVSSVFPWPAGDEDVITEKSKDLYLLEFYIKAQDVREVFLQPDVFLNCAYACSRGNASYLTPLIWFDELRCKVMPSETGLTIRQVMDGSG